MSHGNSVSNQTQLDSLIAEYLEHQERGDSLDREALLRTHPALAEALRAFFAENDRLQRLGQPHPQLSPTVVPAGEHRVGEEILGKYRLLELIGEGGMGAVWLAQQKHPVRRYVAIKLIRAGMDSRQVLARFDAERQALALMDHPHIARVFDGGVTERGRPFFVMEYIKGVPLTEYCDKAQLSLRERLQLFIPVCQAVQHAHVKGIVHRDLKPSNILVCLYDGRAVPKVIDFGLARALHHELTDLTLHTAHGQMVGTPVYMSPEQAEFNNLDIDTRSDIYSLGVVLYELLTGLTPLDKHRLQKAAWDEMLRLIREEDPLPPSTRLSGSEQLPGVAAQRRMDPRLLQRSLSGELDWIVMRALEKERSRRYETSSGLARDIERYLADEAVEACPPSRLYRYRKFFRRHRPQVLAGCTLILGVFAAMAGLAWGWQQARLAEARVSQSLRELLNERSAKERAVAEGQQERLRSRTSRAESILSSITSALANVPDNAAKRSNSSTPKALRSSLQAWSQIQDDAERVGVLEAGLAEPAMALKLARHYPAVLQTAIGSSAERRRLAIEMLVQKQRCPECAPEIRATSCLLTLALGATDLPAMSETAGVFKSGSPLREEFERQLWRRLPEFSDANREEPFRLLLNSRVRFERSSDRYVDVPEEIRRLHLLGQIASAADWYACLEPPDTEAWSGHLAMWCWSRLTQSLKDGSAVLPAADTVGDPVLRGSHLLYRLAPALPEDALDVAVKDMLDILKSSAAGAPGSLDDWTVSRDWMKTLLIRLSPQQLANAAQQLDEILAGPIDQRVFLTFAPVLQEMLPRLSAEQRRAMAGRLFTLVRPSAAWQNFARQSLRWWIAVAVRDFNARETEDCLQPFQLLEETAAKVSATEVLANVLCLHAPQMSAEQAAHWTKLLMLSLDEATSSADLSAERSSVVSFTLGALAPRLSQPDRAALGQQLQTLLNKSENPLPSNAIFLDTILQTVPVLPPELILRIRSELLTAATAELPQSDLLQPALMLADIHSQLLATIIKNTAPSEDTAILDELAAVLEKSPDSGHTSAILAAAFKELASRGDAACVQRIWKITLPILQNQTWGIAYRMTEGPARMFKLAPEEFNEWQQKKFFFSQQIGGLLAVLTERLTPAQAGAAWDDLLGLLKIQAPAGMLSEWNHTRAEICSTALTNLATQIPPSECGQRLKDLIMAARFELTQQSRTMLDSTSHGYSLLSSVLGALAGRTSPDSAREAAVWLKENASQHHPVTLSLAWQAIIPQLPTGTLREFEEHLFHCATLNDGSGLGPHPWLELSLRTGPDALSGRWRDILRLLQTAENRETTEQLCELLMVCVNHVSPAERKLAIQPLLGRLEESLRLPEASEQQLAAFGLDVFRSVLQGRPEASVHDAIIRLSEGLDADSRKELAERCIEVTLRCDADEDWWLLFRETNFPGGVCGDAQQLLKHLGHPNCEGWIGESLLRRFEELLLHGGQPILKVDDAGSKVLALKPDSFKQPQRTFTAPTEPWPKTPPRRFRDVTAAVTWVENHRPEWKAGGVQP